MSGESDRFSFAFEGVDVEAADGTTIAAALMAADVLALRKGPRGDFRGVYCGIGVCFECIVAVDGIGTVRSCVHRAQPGMRVRRVLA